MYTIIIFKSVHTICIWNINLLFWKPNYSVFFRNEYIEKTFVFYYLKYMTNYRSTKKESLYNNVIKSLFIYIPLYLAGRAKKLTTSHLLYGVTQTSGCVNSVVSPQLEQCECCSCSCGQRVGCWLVSVPRTAANSKTLHCPPHDPWILSPQLFSWWRFIPWKQHTLLDVLVDSGTTYKITKIKIYINYDFLGGCFILFFFVCFPLFWLDCGKTYNIEPFFKKLIYLIFLVCFIFFSLHFLCFSSCSIVE